MTDHISERQLVTELEQGKTDHLNGFFKGQFEEERIQSVDRMRDMYLDDVKSGTAKADFLNFNVHHWFGEQIDIDCDLKGKNAYHDTFTVDLKHSSPDDVAAANRKPFDPAEVRKVTTDLENGNPDSLKAALNGLYAEEQIRYIDAIQKLNQADQAAQKTKVGLDLAPDFNKGQNLSFGVSRSAPGFWNFWSNPQEVYSATIDQSGKQSITTRPDERQ